MQNGTQFGSFLWVKYSFTVRPTAIPFLSIFPREMKSYVHTKPCILEQIYSQSNWKQAKCNKMGAWISKLLYIHTTECNSVIRRHWQNTELKQKTHGYKQPQGAISAALGWVQETCLKRLHTVWPHVRDILEKAEHFRRNRKHGSGCWMLGVKGQGWWQTGTRKVSGWTALSFDCLLSLYTKDDFHGMYITPKKIRKVFRKHTQCDKIRNYYITTS